MARNGFKSYLIALSIMVAPALSYADILVSVSLAPPAMPVYVQPPAPAPDNVWTPGYWAYSSFDGYYWVPGTWVVAPTVGYLWTPCYWGWSGGQYIYHGGYWGEHVGFYGGINYGYGYGGSGFYGGGWRNGAYVNRPVTNVTYNTTNAASSFNGGPGGTTVTPTPAEQAAANEPHVPQTAEQESHASAASQNPALRASVNHGKPAIAATSKPGVFSGNGVVAARQPAAARAGQASNHQPDNAAARPQSPATRTHPQTAARAAGQKPQAPPKHQAQPKPRPRRKHS